MIPDGLPNLAAFADSDESFAIYRRFGYLQARVLLDRQEELSSLEKQLDIVDKADMNDNVDALCTRDSDEGHAAERRVLLDLIQRRYSEYGLFSCSRVFNRRCSLMIDSQSSNGSISACQLAQARRW